jgi:hypothetical protein
VFTLSACQGIYGVLIVVGAIFGAQWGIVGVAMATLAALLVFYLLLYAVTARVSGASVLTFFAVHARPILVFAIVLATSLPVRRWLRGVDWPPSAILFATVAVSTVALLGATRMLRQRLWGDFLYEQGMAALGQHTRSTEVENREDDDIST